MKLLMKVSIALVFALCAGVAFAAGGSDAPDAYPSKAVTVIIPYSAGGGSDLSVRALVEASKDKFPENISVENRTGGAGIVGMLYGSKSKADGYTITMTAPELLILPHTGGGSGLHYTDLTPILMFNSAYAAITVNKDSPYNTLEEFVEASKSEEIQVGNSGVGSIWHLAGAGFAQAADTSFTYVPFEGAAPAITDLLGGHIDAVSVSYAEVATQVEAGQLKVLAVLAPERLAEAPSIPTAKELGYDVSLGTWRALTVPKDTPDEIVATLYDIFSETVTRDNFKKFMADSNNAIDVMDGPSLQKKMETEDAIFAGLVKDLNLAN